MNYNEAIKTLELQNAEVLTKRILKIQYKKMALKYHPDKNIGDKSKEAYHEKITKINNAYEFLCENVLFDNDNETTTTILEEDFNYNSILKTFIKLIFKDKISDKNIEKIEEIITSKCKKITLLFFQELDIEITIQIYNFLTKYKDILFLDNELLEEIRNIIQLKRTTENDESLNFVDVETEVIDTFVLNPNLEDLFNDKVYILKIPDNDDKIHEFYIPLWINNITLPFFINNYNAISNNNSSEKNTNTNTVKEYNIVVYCVPEIDNEDIQITSINDVIIKKTLSIKNDRLFDLLVNEDVPLLKFEYGKKEFVIHLDELKMKKSTQYIYFKEKGILRKNGLDIYDTSNRGDVIFEITIDV